MHVHGNYEKDGYVRLERLMAPEVTKALLDQFWRDLLDGKLPVQFRQSPILTKPVMELHGSKSPAITTFLWGLTPTISELTKCDLLPSYAFFRLYQGGDKLGVHIDRNACEHSLSLTLGYSDGEIWDFNVGHNKAPPKAGKAEDFGKEPYSTIQMDVGDAVLYKGISRRHARLVPNPNKWSAHLFLHWVDREGEYRHHAFEGCSDTPNQSQDTHE